MYIHVCIFVCVADNLRLITLLHKLLNTVTDGKARQLNRQISEF